MEKLIKPIEEQVQYFQRQINKFRNMIAMSTANPTVTTLKPILLFKYIATKIRTIKNLITTAKTVSKVPRTLKMSTILTAISMITTAVPALINKASKSLYRYAPWRAEMNLTMLNVLALERETKESNKLSTQSATNKPKVRMGNLHKWLLQQTDLSALIIGFCIIGITAIGIISLVGYCLTKKQRKDINKNKTCSTFKPNYEPPINVSLLDHSIYCKTPSLIDEEEVVEYASEEGATMKSFDNEERVEMYYKSLRLLDMPKLKSVSLLDDRHEYGKEVESFCSNDSATAV